MDPHSAFVWKRGQDAIDNGTNQIYFGNSRIAANRAVRANRQAPRMTEIGAEMAQRYAKQYRTMLDFFTGIMQMKNSVAEESAAVLLGSQSESIQELCQCMQQFEKNTQQSQHAVGQ